MILKVRSHLFLTVFCQTVKDLNLEEMFEVFDQADSTVPASAIPKGFLGSEFDPKTAVGSSAPLKFFDPAGFSNDITEEQFKLYQEAEIKHGRVTMLAFLGIVVGEIAKGPLFDGAITGPAIYQFQQTYSILPYLWIVILAGITAVEGISIASFWQPLEDTLKEPLAIAKLRSTHVAGDLGFDPLGLKPKSNDALKSIR